MNAGTVIVIVVVLLIAAGAVGHLIAHQIWPTRRRIWRQRADIVEEEAKELGRENDLEKPDPLDEAVAEEQTAPPQGTERSTPRRRRAGLSPEDLDY